MKSFIYKSIFALAVLSLFAQQAQAQKYDYTDKQLKQSVKAYEWSLSSDNSMVVESVLYNVLLLKRHYPELNYKSLVKKLRKLSLNGETPAIRSKAFVAAMFYDVPDMFQDVKLDTSIEDAAPYYKDLLNKMETYILAAN